MAHQKFHLGIKAFILNEKNEILILKINPNQLKGEDIVHWDLPGGRIEEGDNVEKTIKKELNEELNIDPSNIQILDIFDASISNIKILVGKELFGLILFTYKCKLKGKYELELSSEHTDYKWATVEEAKKLLSYKFSKSFIDKLNMLNGSMV